MIQDAGLAGEVLAEARMQRCKIQYAQKITAVEKLQKLIPIVTKHNRRMQKVPEEQTVSFGTFSFHELFTDAVKRCSCFEYLLVHLNLLS